MTTALQLAYRNDQELPVWLIDDWRDNSGAPIDFSTGWTFSLRLCHQYAPTTTLLLKTTGITGSAAGVTVAWAVADWAGLPADSAAGPGSYVVYVYARRTADSFDAVYRADTPPRLTLYAAAGTSAVSPSSYPITVTAASVTVVDAGGYGTTTPKTAETMLQDFGARIQPFAPSSGQYFRPTGNQQTAVATLNRLCYTRVDVGKAVPMDRIGCLITAGAASSVVRLGIYASAANGYPGALILEAGTIDSSTTLWKEIIISQIGPAGRFWFGAVAQGGTPTTQVITAATALAQGFIQTFAGSPNTATSLVASNPSQVFENGITGALPALATPSWDGSFVNAIAVAARAA